MISVDTYYRSLRIEALDLANLPKAKRKIGKFLREYEDCIHLEKNRIDITCAVCLDKIIVFSGEDWKSKRRDLSVLHPDADVPHVFHQICLSGWSFGRGCPTCRNQDADSQFLLESVRSPITQDPPGSMADAADRFRRATEALRELTEQRERQIWRARAGSLAVSMALAVVAVVFFRNRGSS